MRRRYRNPAQRLRTVVERLPQHTRRAMLHGLDRNRIIVGAYTDPRSGGICPMLAAHRNGGRTDLASFAIAWDAFTNARRPRLATRRELRTLRSFLEISLVEATTHETGSIAAAAARIRAERVEIARRNETERAAHAARATDPTEHPEPDIRIARRVHLPGRRRDGAKDLIAVAQKRLSEQRAAELLSADDSESAPREHLPAGGS